MPRDCVLINAKVVIEENKPVAASMLDGEVPRRGRTGVDFREPLETYGGRKGRGDFKGRFILTVDDDNHFERIMIVLGGGDSLEQCAQFRGTSIGRNDDGQFRRHGTYPRLSG